MFKTESLTLREFTTEDAPFILELLNDPAWIKFIGDRGVRNLKDARTYIHERLIISYQEQGFGMWLVEKEGISIGTCGLLKRDYLDELDIGFAFLPAYRGKGYAYEAAKGMMVYAKDVLKKKRLLAFVLVGNHKSIALLKRLGMQYQRNFRIPDDDADLELYEIVF